tara:strand:- start:40991 stop:41902 length:912 start_codon:yes stop_codon:yes gene_type:complete
MIFYLLLFFIFFINAQNDSPPPKLDLRNFNGTIRGLTMHNSPSTLLPKESFEDVLLFDSQIEEIKDKAKQFVASPLEDNDVAIFSTNYGLLKFKLYHKESPINCLNFKQLANSKFYDNTLFHQIIPKFIIQGGDILTRNHNPDDDGQGGPGWTVNAEFNDLKHRRGTLSMFRVPNNPNSAGSQFFISISDRESDNKSLDGNYTIIAQLVEGDHVLSRISKIPSENTQAKLSCRASIPEGEDYGNWIELVDPLLKNMIYCKVPPAEDKNSYSDNLRKMLNNIYKPGIPVIIDSIRVINEKNNLK